MRSKKILSLAVASVLATASFSFAQMESDKVTYDVTITNMTSGQPLSPPILVTHSPDMHVWQMGQVASPAMEMVAESGMTEDLVKSLEHRVTDIQAAKMSEKIMPGKSMTMKIKAKPGEVLSAAMMVAASNDTFTGVDSCPLDEKGMKMMNDKMAAMGKDAMGKSEMMMKDGMMSQELMAMDAGTEENTEKTSDTAAPEMGKGHPASNPPQPIGMSEGIKGTGDLDKAKFGWTGPVAKIEIKKEGM